MIMTDEQIKQNAEQYALKKTLISTDSFHGMVESYLEGAHSRDEEIKQLRKALSSAQQAMVEFAERARSPWISVKDRLPKYCTVPSTEQYIKNRRYWNNKVAPIYLVICSDPQGDYYYQFANFIKFPEDKKPCWVFVEDNIKRNCGTHWMLIPKVNKEK